MFNYIAFLHSGIEKAGESPIEDGKALAARCLDKLNGIDNKDQFPPKLLILFVSASYLDSGSSLDETKAGQLIAGIHQTFSEADHHDIPLIGSSVAAVFFDNRIYPEGVLLVCLASRLLDAKVAVGRQVSTNYENAVNTLLGELDIEHSLNEYPRPRPNRALLTFFPGTGESGVNSRHSTDELHSLLWKRLTYRIPIVGGVSSADDPTRQKRGLQFVDRQVFTDALAACLILSGVPLGTSLAKGLEPLRNAPYEVVHVKSFSKDGKTIEEFYEGTPAEVLKGVFRPVLFKDLPPGGDFLRAACLQESDYKVVKVLRKVSVHAALEVMTPSPAKMLEEAVKSCEMAMRRARIEIPIGCLSVQSASHYRYREVLRLNIENGITEMGVLLNGSPYVGGFFDGEAGTVENGSSEIGNWSVAAVVLGDEMSERTAVQGGFASLASHGVELMGSFKLKGALDQSLGLIYDVGFPGAMISILLPDQEKERFIPMKAKGFRFERLLELMREKDYEDQVPESIEREKKPLFIPDSNLAYNAVEDVVRESAILSQYVIPMLDPEDRIFAILRVDLGDARSRNEVDPAVEKVLEPIAAIVGATINRIFNWEENRIARSLDNALKAGLRAESLRYGLQRFLEEVSKAFSLEMGHIRLFNADENSLDLVAGYGKYYEAAREHRLNPNIGDWSPAVEAFAQNRTMIINDAVNNPSTQAMRKKYSDIPQMSEALQGVGSYANLPLSDEYGQKIGTISLVTEQRWLFLSYHERALAALARRVSYLIDYFGRKESEDEAHRQMEDLSKRLKFLLDVSPKLHKIPNFDDVQKVLGDAIKNFCEAASAEVGSLYLWDEDQQQYILRAEHGWLSKGWIRAARYEKGSGWIGSESEDRPLHVPNLYEYYLEREYTEPGGRYAVHILGREFSKGFPVEAIAVPLRVSGERLGVLTLYRRKTPRRSDRLSDFEITYTGLLEEGGNHIAGLVKLLLSRQTALFDQLAQERQENIYTALTSIDEDTTFETTVCEKALIEFNAFQIHFYKLEKRDSPSSISWVRGFRRVSSDAGIEEIPKQSPDPTIEGVARTKKVKSFPRCLTAEERKDPKKAATEGFIERAYIPLMAVGSLVGILDLQWDADASQDASLIGRLGSIRLTEMGQMIGSAYWRNRLALQQKEAEEETERSRLAVQAVGAMVFQTAHRLGNLVQKIYRLYLKVKEAKNKSSRDRYIGKLSDVIDDAMNKIKWPMDIPQRIQRLSREKSYLLPLIKQTLKEVEYFESSTEISPSVPDDLVIIVNPDLTKEALLNLINNAVRTVKDKQGGVVKIWADKVDKKNARIVIEDTGMGMTEEEIQNAKRGFGARGGHTGVGVLISSVLLHVQGGSLVFDSTKGIGTKAIITLPLE